MWDGVLCRVGETGKVDGYERTGGKGEFGKEGARKGELGKSVGWGKGEGERGKGMEKRTRPNKKE